MSDEHGQDNYDLTGLVQVVFSEDRLKHLLHRIHMLLDRHNGRIQSIEAEFERVNKLQPDLNRLGERLNLLDSTFQRRSEQLERSASRNYEELCEKNRILLKQTESKIEQSRATMKSCSDFLRRQFTEAMEASRKDRACIATSLSELVKREMQTVNDQISQVRTKYSVLEEQYNRSSMMMSLSTVSTRTVEGRQLRQSTKQNNQNRMKAHPNVQQQNSSSSLSQPDKDDDKLQKSPKASYHTKTGKNNKAGDPELIGTANNKHVAAMNSRMDQLEQKQNRLEMIFNRNPRAFFGKGSMPNEQQEAMMQTIRQYQSQCRQEVEKLSEKCIFLQEQNKTICNQLETMRVKLEHETRQVRRTIPSRRSENLQASVLSTQIKLSVQEFQSQLENKVDICKVEALQSRINSKLEALQYQLTEKSDKEDVKRALMFIEGKLKDVIMLVAQVEKQQKDALFTKTMMKCLSCDKEVERVPTAGSGDFRSWKVMPSKQSGRHGLTTATITRKNRKDCSRDISREQKPMAMNFDDEH